MKRTLYGISCAIWLCACGESVQVGGPPDDGEPSDQDTGDGDQPSEDEDTKEDSASDARAQAESHARPDIACKTSTDCCVVYDACTATALVVSAADRESVRSLLDGAPEDKCVGCISPVVQVDCVNEVCVGTSLDFSEEVTWPEGTSDDHCGFIGEPEPMEPDGVKFGCGIHGD